MNYDECRTKLIAIIREWVDEHNEDVCDDDRIDDASILELAVELNDFIAREIGLDFGPPPRPGVVDETHASISDMVRPRQHVIYTEGEGELLERTQFEGVELTSGETLSVPREITIT